MFIVIQSSPSLSNLQRCYFPPDIPSEYCGKHVFLTTSAHNRYLVKISVNPLLKSRVCFLDTSVQCISDLTPLTYAETVSPESLDIIPSIKFIKAIRIEVIFVTVWDRQKWMKKVDSFTKIIKNILSLFILSNNLSVSLVNKKFINTFGIHSISVKSIGFNSPGKVVSTTKVEIVNFITYERYVLRKQNDLSPTPGLQSHTNRLRDLLKSYRPLPNSSDSSSLKVLICGPDGCGKKTVVRSAAGEVRAVLLKLSGPELSRPLPGETQKLLANKFHEAELHSQEGPTILLLERLESVFSSGGKERRGRVGLTRLLDSTPPSLAVVATSARPQLLHQSSQYTSRFQSQIHISVPTEEERCEMLSRLCGGLLTHEDSLELAKRTQGFVLSDILLLLSKAKRLCLMNNSTVSPANYFEAALESLYDTEGSATRGELGLVSRQRLRPTELGGLNSIKQLLVRSLLWPLLYADKFTAFNLPSTSGVLLYGPPGCAKTSLIRSLAGSSPQLTFFSVSAADLLSPYVGEAEVALSSLFERARQAAPSLLFIDEIDALTGSRMEKERGAHERLLSTFLIEMDGVSSTGGATSGVGVVGATNRPGSVDPALLRPGRLDRQVYVPPPSSGDRLLILQVLTQQMPLGDCVDLHMLAERTHMFSGADLKSLCQEAGLRALGLGREVVLQEDWLAGLEEVRPSISTEQLQIYIKFNNSP